MVEVNLWSGLRGYAGGTMAVTVEAATIGEMLDELERAHPGLGPALEEGVSVVVDGKVIAANRTTPISPANEIFLMRRLRGG